MFTALIIIGTAARFKSQYNYIYEHTLELQQQAKTYYDTNCKDMSHMNEYNEDRINQIKKNCDIDKHLLSTDASQAAYLEIFSSFGLQSILGSINDAPVLTQIFWSMFLIPAIVVVIVLLCCFRRYWDSINSHLLPVGDEKQKMA